MFTAIVSPMAIHGHAAQYATSGATNNTVRHVMARVAKHSCHGTSNASPSKCHGACIQLQLAQNGVHQSRLSASARADHGRQLAGCKPDSYVCQTKSGRRGQRLYGAIAAIQRLVCNNPGHSTPAASHTVPECQLPQPTSRRYSCTGW